MSLIVRIKINFGSFKLDVNFENNGGVRSLLGESGSGKSLTLKCIAGIIKPDEGYIELNGRVLFDSANKINLSPQKRKVGFMFQNYALFPNMNVKQNIMTGLHSNKELTKKEKEERVDEVLHLFQLENLTKHHINQISGGQQQRVALARILVSSPEIILLDEPFAALDEHLRTTLQMEMKEFLAKYGKDVILVTHNRDEAYLLSDETTILSDGSSVINKSTKELFLDPEYLQASIITGCKNNVSINKIDKDNIYIDDWGINIPLEGISEEYSYIGIRAHSFKKKGKELSYDINIIEIVEEPFENMVLFRFANQKEGTPNIIWKTDKKEDINEETKKIYLNKSDIMLLKK